MATPPPRYRFPAPHDLVPPSDERKTMQEVFTDVVALIKERGGEAATHDDPHTGNPTIIAQLTMPETIATVAEVLFGEKYHKWLSPAFRRNIIYSMTNSYTKVDLPKPTETMQ